MHLNHLWKIYNINSLIFDFAIFRVRVRPRFRGFLPGYFTPPTPFGHSTFSQNQKLYINVFSNEHFQIQWCLTSYLNRICFDEF